MKKLTLKKSFQIALILISVLTFFIFILKLFLDYLDNKTTSNPDFERIYKIEREFKKLLSLKINSTAKITEEEKKELLENLIIQFENGITENFRKKIEDKFKIGSLQQYSDRAIFRLLMCAEKTGGFNLVNYRHSSGVYHEQETEDLHRRI